ncbi:MAG: hypothetical protein GC200_09120 [Tepidisphaera sp.]|nr:hypothetical protein [Tepidisphaera sp.]
MIMRLYVCAVVAGLAGVAGVAQADLLTNGDFEAGNTGFANDYGYYPVSVSPYYGQYGVTHSSFEWSNFWHNIGGDHTTGTGQFLIADVGPSGAIWRQTVSLAPGSQVTFSGWLATWTSYPAATLNVVVDGVPVASWSAPGSAVWTQYSATWTAGTSGSSTIELVPASFFQPGDDVAVDDLTLVPAPGAAIAGLALLAGLRRGR